jgi:hypothetical protein
MAYPVVNSPMFPSVADAGFLPPKLRDMPIFNPGTRRYRCPDGQVRMLTENQAINGNCVLDEGGYLMGQASPAPSGGAGTPSPASPSPSFNQGFDRGRDFRFDQLQQFNWPYWPSVVRPPALPQVPPGTTCAWEKDVNNNDVYVCRPAAGAPVIVAPPPPAVIYGPVGIPAQTIFRFF